MYSIHWPEKTIESLVTKAGDEQIMKLIYIKANSNLLVAKASYECRYIYPTTTRGRIN